MKLCFNVKFKEGDDVIVVTDPEARRKVSGYLIRNGHLFYGVITGEDESWHPESDIEPYPDCRKVFVVKGFFG